MDFQVSFFCTVEGQRALESLGSFSANVEMLQAGRTDFIISQADSLLTHACSFGDLQIMPYKSFLDYTKAGCRISLGIAIDFTKSNGMPSSSHSLHNWDYEKNEYVAAVKTVCETLLSYDATEKVTLLGYGAKPDSSHEAVSHCFALNGDLQSPEVEGLSGILSAYEEALSRVKMAGPTCFEPLLRYTMERVEK